MIESAKPAQYILAGAGCTMLLHNQSTAHSDGTGIMIMPHNSDSPDRAGA